MPAGGDGSREQRRGTVSVFNGPQPVVRVFDTAAAEAATIGKWLALRGPA